MATSTIKRIAGLNNYTNIDSGNLNDFRTSGVYYVGSGITNSPANYMVLLVINAGDVVQIGASGGTGKMYFRTYAGYPRSWSGWHTVSST